MTELEYFRPGSSEDVSAFLQRDGTMPFAGATDVLVQLRAERVHPHAVVDLNSLPELGEIRVEVHGGITIGATVRMSTLASDPHCTPYPALVEGARTVGSVQVRNRATLVGNICNGSPAADTAPGLLVYEAVVNVLGARGRRSLPIEAFWRGPGQTALEPGEWVESVTLPPPDGHGGCYVKLGRTLGTDLAIVGVAAFVSERDVRVALASVAPTPLRAHAVEALLPPPPPLELPPGAVEALQELIKPISDLRSSARYRRAMTVVLVERALKLAAARLENGNEGQQ